MTNGRRFMSKGTEAISSKMWKTMLLGKGRRREKAKVLIKTI